jgi:cardiolipin synthase
LLYVVSEWLIRLLMLGIVIERHPPRTAMLWLLVIYFLPWPGLLLYFLIGENRLPHRRLVKRQALQKRLDELQQRHVPSLPSARAVLDQDFLPAIKLAETLGRMPIMFGNRVQLLNHAHDVIDRLVADIEAAERHVHLLFYIFEVDATGLRVCAALERAVERGVKCRLLVDDVGSRSFLRHSAQALCKRGVEVYATLPVNLLRAAVSRIDLRNHRKIAIIDSRIGYAGSQNIVDPGYGRKGLQWFDLMVRLSGPVVLELQAVFIGDWYAESDQLLESDDIFPRVENPLGEGAPAQVLPSGPLEVAESYQRLTTAAIYSARHRVSITTPYFVPDEVFLVALETAALKGVEVEIILPRRSDQRVVGYAARGYFERLLKVGVIIHQYRKGVLHTKSMTIDDSLAFVGSSNFDIRSFALNFEINLIFYQPEFAAELYQQHQSYKADSHQVSLEEWLMRPWYKRILQNITRLLSPLL